MSRTIPMPWRDNKWTMMGEFHRNVILIPRGYGCDKWAMICATPSGGVMMSHVVA